jgi:thiol-disulfide isomerase/thioredoxin
MNLLRKKMITKFLTLALLITMVGSKSFTPNPNLPSLYDYTGKDNVQVLDFNNFDTVVYPANSTGMWFIEYYAHWCGTCKRYSAIWKKMALETKNWHENVIRFAVVNCGANENSELCQHQDVKYYPKLVFYSTNLRKINGEYNSGHEISMAMDPDKVLKPLVEKITESKTKEFPNMPQFEQYSSKNMRNFFGISIANIGFLIIEKEDSLLGARIILDFSHIQDQVLIRRATKSKNGPLLTYLNLNLDNESQFPLAVLITKAPASRMLKHQVLSEALIKQLALDNDITQTDSNQNDNKDLENDPFASKTISIMIERYLRMNKQIPNKSNEKQHEHDDQITNGPQSPSVLPSPEKIEALDFNDSLHMDDLESGLNFMIRSDMSNFKSLEGDQLEALKQWLRVLVKYYPGRKIIKN